MKKINLQPKQSEFLSSSADIAISGGSAGGGKALDINTPVPTPVGWTTMGELVEGDVLFAADGSQCQVLIAYPVYTPDKSYRIEFDDGEVVIACSDHKWCTLTSKELGQITRYSEGWRERRRNHRPSRATWKKGAGVTAMLFERNKRMAEGNRPNLKRPPDGSVKTTEEIYRSLSVRGRANHAIAVAGMLQTPDIELPIDPYLLGAWLGDGCSIGGSITTADTEVVEAFRAQYEVTKWKSELAWEVHGLQTQLRALGLLGNKHIPAPYLRAGPSQRLALLQGLMDTDGCSCKSGAVEFTSTNRDLAYGVQELALSLGSKAVVKTGRATLYGKDCGEKYRIKWSPDYSAFRLQRKLLRQRIDGHRRTTKLRYIKRCEPVPSVKMRCITTNSPDGLFLCGRGMIPTHNSWALLLEPLRHIHVPGFGAGIFRLTYPQITMEGGLWSEAMRLYSNIPGATHSELTWRFPSGARISFMHMEAVDYQVKYKGTQIALIEFDQLEDFSKEQVFFMLSRNRSVCGVAPYVRASCNPDPDSWLAKFLEWWIDQDTGYAIEARSGKIRWMLRLGDELFWADSKEEMVRKYGPDSMPLSVAFVPSTVYDNPALLKVNPQYLANLKALPYVEMERLLKGNWKVRPAAGKVFNREWFKIVEWDDVPEGGMECRAWDFASTAKSSRNRDPDFTAGVLLLFAPDNICYVLDVVNRQCDPANVDDLFYSTIGEDQGDASEAGAQYMVCWEQEPGSAGKLLAWHMSAKLTGYDYQAVSPGSGDKPTRWRTSGFISACKAGRVRIVRGDWNDAFISNLHNQPDAAHDDMPDAAAMAYRLLVQSMGAGAMMR